MAYDSDVRNFVVTFQDWEGYNCKTEEEAIQKAKDDYGNDIEIISVE
jgi:hypothetical protein